MSLEVFQLLDNEPIFNSIVKRGFMKVYHQQGEQMNDPNQNIAFIFGENNNYHQIGNAYLDIDITVKDATAGFSNNSELRLVNNAFAFCFTEGTISTTTGVEKDHVKFLRQVSTIKRALTSKDGDLLSDFDNINNTDANTSMNINSLKDSYLILQR